MNSEGNLCRNYFCHLNESSNRWMREAIHSGVITILVTRRRLSRVVEDVPWGALRQLYFHNVVELLRSEIGPKITIFMVFLW